MTIRRENTEPWRETRARKRDANSEQRTDAMRLRLTTRRDQPSRRRLPFGPTAAPHRRSRSPGNRRTGTGLRSVVETTLHHAREAAQPEAARFGFDRFADGATRRREDRTRSGEMSEPPAGDHRLLCPADRRG